MKIVNLTTHKIVVRLPDGDRVFEPSGQVVRCVAEAVSDGNADGIPIMLSFFGALNDLPAPQDGVLYLCSTPAAQKASQMGRTDVVAPDTGPTAIRVDGQIVAVTRFQRF